MFQNFSHGNGLSVVGKVFDKAVNFFVDTESAVTLLSVSVVKHLDKDDFELVDVPFDIYLADGQKVQVEGQALLDITLGPLKVEYPVIIADIRQQTILGMLFMSKQECKLDLHHLVMVMSCGMKIGQVHNVVEYQYPMTRLSRPYMRK